MCPRSSASLDSLFAGGRTLTCTSSSSEGKILARVNRPRGSQAWLKPDTLRTCRSSLSPRFSLVASFLFPDPFPQERNCDCCQFKTHLLIALGSSSSTHLEIPGKGSDWQARGHMSIPEPIAVVERRDFMIAPPTTGRDLPAWTSKSGGVWPA